MDLALLSDYARGAAFALLGVIYLLAAGALINRRAPGGLDAAQAVTEGNVAVAVRQFGLYFGLGLGLAGYLATPSEEPFLTELGGFLVEGVLMVLFILIARRVAERIVTPEVANDLELMQRKVSVAVVELGLFTGTGLVAWGAFSGSGGGMASALLFFVLGQGVLVLTAWLYQRYTHFDDMMLIGEGRLAPAVMLAGTLVAMGLILRGSIAGPFVSWERDLISFGLSVVVGYALLFAVVALVDLRLYPHHRLQALIEQDNLAVAINSTAIKLVAALLIGSVAL